MKKWARTPYAVCITNRGYAASLKMRKLYAALPDPSAAKAGFRRIIDESGEDFLYPEEYFVDIKLPRSVERVVKTAF